MKKYIPVIGLEVHIEPNTKSKMFCACPQDHFGKAPNSQTCPVCLGLPGALPFANRAGVEKTVKLGLALGSKISKFSRFFRKHYFYPDLPKSFQTSQKDDPLCMGGELLGKAVNHIHLEEDAGKLIHEDVDGRKVSLVDFNRGGCALIELVTEPVFHSTEEVLAFVKELQLLARYIDISGADMEKGTMRLEANVSLAKVDNGETEIKDLPPYKVELKNINSFRFLEKAISAELIRQEELLDNGEKISQETRGYDEIKQKTYSQRSKEESQDYRYFPEADLPPIELTDAEVKKIKDSLPEFPWVRRERFTKEFGLPKDFVEILVSDKGRADYYEELVKLSDNSVLSSKTLADFMINKKFDEKYPEPAGLAKYLLELTKVEYASGNDTEQAVKEVLSENSKAVEDYKKGQVNVIGFLIGMVQKKLQGKGNINSVKETILNELNK
jgi:aspartyl-tRNA(Asn)/glutamyl-tRNA(Gln) amidotransferase subunit B